jgi:hypothetical protein
VKGNRRLSNRQLQYFSHHTGTDSVQRLRMAGRPWDLIRERPISY